VPLDYTERASKALYSAVILHNDITSRGRLSHGHVGLAKSNGVLGLAGMPVPAKQVKSEPILSESLVRIHSQSYVIFCHSSFYHSRCVGRYSMAEIHRRNVHVFNPSNGAEVAGQFD
jgi:hypothetical protein